jgi:hypothetical protein
MNVLNGDFNDCLQQPNKKYTIVFYKIYNIRVCSFDTCFVAEKVGANYYLKVGALVKKVIVLVLVLRLRL